MKHKLKKLDTLLKIYKRVLIAFSGGCDSSFIAAYAVKVLGPENVLTITALSETYTPDEQKKALLFAKKYHIQHHFISTRELLDKNFIRNFPDRCYFCKNELFKKLHVLAQKHDMQLIDGSTMSDARDVRPGMAAAAQWNVRHPLAEARFSKTDIRQASKSMRLPTWNMPQQACLASRIPYGTPITSNILRTIYRAEKHIKKFGFSMMRVRSHGTIARIELLPQEIKKIFYEKIRINIIRYFKKLGFTFITVDLDGYRTGSLNYRQKNIN